MPTDWLQDAERTFAKGTGPMLDVAPRIAVHTTEGSTIEGAIATYKVTGDFPHITADLAKRRVSQHVSFSQYATALQNLPGGVETNRMNCIQIEIVGFAKDSANRTDAELQFLGELLARISASLARPVKAEGPAMKAYPASYGANGVRLTNALWTAFNGVCGHQHIPENLHGDPGALNMVKVFSYMAGNKPPKTTTEVDPDMPTPHDKIDEIVYDLGNGQIGKTVLYRDGEVNNFGTQHYFHMGALRPQDKQGFSEAKAITPVNANDHRAGYIVWSQNGSQYKFDKALADSIVNRK